MSPKNINDIHIVCVDDEPEILDALKRSLRSFNLHTFSSYKDAIFYIENHKDDVDIFMTDFQMPDINGLELLEKVRSISPNSVRIILSGQIDLSSVSDGLNNSLIHKLLLKPWSNEGLQIQILEALSLRSLISEKEYYKNLSEIDTITELPNHRAFQDNLRTFKPPFTLLMIDVDHFKSYNDHYGHPEGDRLLKEIAKRLRKHLPKNSLIARYGGEEFAALIDATEFQTEKIAEDLRLAFETQAFRGNMKQPIYITISIGLAHYPQNTENTMDLVEFADRALYQAKRQGRNQTVVAV